MIFTMTGQEKGDLLIQVTTWAGLTVFTLTSFLLNSHYIAVHGNVLWCCWPNYDDDFFRIKKGYPYEARVITRVLPTFLADFFPPQDIMNKVIGEFISSQQPYPQLVAHVVFQV